MIRQLKIILTILVFGLPRPGIAEELRWLGEEQRKQLDSGKFVVLPNRPDETVDIDPVL